MQDLLQVSGEILPVHSLNHTINSAIQTSYTILKNKPKLMQAVLADNIVKPHGFIQLAPGRVKSLLQEAEG